MGNAYELDGQLFTNVGEFLDALGHEYKHGDKDLAVQTLEDYGFSLSDINAAVHQPHPQSVKDDAHATQTTDEDSDDATDEDEEDEEDEEE